MDVLCCQSSVQDLRVRPRLGKPGRQSCVSRGSPKGLAGPEQGQSEKARTPGPEGKPQDVRRGGASDRSLPLRANGSEHWGGSGIPATERGAPHPWLHQERAGKGRAGEVSEGHVRDGGGSTRRLLARTVFNTVLFKTQT